MEGRRKEKEKKMFQRKGHSQISVLGVHTALGEKTHLISNLIFNQKLDYTFYE